MLLHRNIDHDGIYTHTAIENVIDRGAWPDWMALFRAARNDPEVRRRVFETAEHYVDHPYTNRFKVWLNLMQRDEEALSECKSE